MKFKNILPFLALTILVSCPPKADKLQFRSPGEIGKLVFSRTELEQIRSGMHSSQEGLLCFSSKESVNGSIRKELPPASSLSIAFWVTPEFTGRNGTIMTLSKKVKDFPIKSNLSIYLNKNRIAFMQQGKDIRKDNYDQRNHFTEYFLERQELEKGVPYFLTFAYSEHTATLYKDGRIYARYENLPDLENTQFITLGYAWNEDGIKYKFDGCLDDIYIFERALDSIEVNEVMDYTHFFRNGR